MSDVAINSEHGVTNRDCAIRLHRYVCSLYWALSVMTNLKGPPAHETRQCLWHEPEVSFMVNPLGERVYTIFVFMVGCVLFSCICAHAKAL